MEDVFTTLRSLQDILSKKYEIQNEIEEIPKALSTKSELLNRLKKSYIEKNEQYEELKKRIASLRIRLSDAEQLREKYERQMDDIKTQREYEALDKEISDATEKEQQLRKELQKEEKNLEEMTHTLQRDEGLIDQQENELEEENEKVRQETSAKEQLLRDLEEEEKALTPGLDDEIRFKFERIIKSKAGVGIVPIQGDVCTGCHMMLPAQFVNRVRAGRGIEFCPYCSRILYYQDSEVDETMTFSDEDTGSLADLANLGEDEADTGEDIEAEKDLDAEDEHPGEEAADEEDTEKDEEGDV
ncbi:MAG: nucleic acid-binding protein [Spirochaetales bacterium]|nr:nucleic acid-binding protein [Spirochaetales bacterium]